jgi:hypothetical protein
MTIKRILAIAAIYICTSLCWGILGTSLIVRSTGSFDLLARTVCGVWGPVMTQGHPVIYYNVLGSSSGRHTIQPSRSDVNVTLNYEPRKKGLLWYRTYLVDFHGDYTVENPTPITQTMYIEFRFPARDATYSDVSFAVNGLPAPADDAKGDGAVLEAVTLPPGGSAKVSAAYKTRGTDSWGYYFGDTTRITNFHLAMGTDFSQIDFPAGTGSPTGRSRTAAGWNLEWSYPDVINAQAIGMNMPAVLNPGPVASRITFFSPVSLLFYFTVLLLLCLLQGVDLHPMNYFFLAAGCFAFQLLFAYLVDLIPLLPAFCVAAAVSLALVSGYLYAVAGWRLARVAALAQFGYMVLFSYSFFFDGLTGLTITIGAIITLALLMGATAKVNWSEKFAPRRATPPPLRKAPGAAI